MNTARYDNQASADSARFLRDQEAAARHEADRHDRHDYIRINGQTYDAADVPDLADVADLDERWRR